MGWRTCVYCAEKYHTGGNWENKRLAHDKLCPHCIQLIQEAEQARKDAEKPVSKFKVILGLPKANYNWPGFYYSSPHSNHQSTDEGGLRFKLRIAWADLYRAIGKPVHKFSKYLPPWTTTYLTDRFSIESDAQKAEFSLNVYRALKTLRYLTEKVIDETYQGGVEDGRNIIYQIASGQITQDAISKHDIERAKQMQQRSEQLEKNLTEEEE